MPRVRRLRREAPTLELLAATLPELRLGLSDAAARTVAYEVFEKVGTAHKKFVVAGPHLTHSGLLIDPKARERCWPAVADWLDETLRKK